MARKCQISGITRQVGHNVSHAKNRTKRVYKANLQEKKIFVPEEKRSVRVKVSTWVLRTIDKLGLAGTLKTFGMKLADILA